MPFSVLRRHTDFLQAKNHLLLVKFFDTMISPILTYISEIWGVYTKPEFKAWDSSQIEKNTSTVLQMLPRSKQ